MWKYLQDIDKNCRYAEAIDIMYAEPLFDFTYTDYGLHHLSSLLLPQRMHRITKIVYCWNCQRRLPRLGTSRPDYFTQLWLDTWETLAHMESLKYLVVDIMLDVLSRADWIADQERILKSMQPVLSRKFNTFELTGLPFASLEGDGHNVGPPTGLE